MRDHFVVVFAHAPVSLFELSCAVEIFGRSRAELGLAWYDFAIAAVAPGAIASLGGIELNVPHGLDVLTRADTIIIPAWDSELSPPGALADALLAASARGARILSICSGAFLLASLGLLDGRRAATHWMYADKLQAAYPAVRVDPDVLYVDEGDIVTAAGSAAGLDMLLHIVRRDHGSKVCNAVARRLNIPPHREGGQSQFAIRPVVELKDSRLTGVIKWMREHSAEEMTVEELAKRAAMSARTFFRRFKETTGQSPYDWLLMERIAVARELLETGRLSIDQTAFHAGFSSAETMRIHFKRVVGCTPADYRRQFCGETAMAVAAE
ncbi:MAG: transcriptional regulator FtrA [Sphingopyxis solisilvae]|uniref:transcriptional regulator FtrA n=1 Tax=Sphingopyxis solisilvae TaxID=1886788 RepID=UPI0040365996